MTKDHNQRSLTRKQLYDLVWKKPAMQIAKEYGLSDRGLGKLCERQGIPTPPRGYWAKIESGQKIKKPPLLFSERDGEGEKILEPRVKEALRNRELDSEEVLSKEILEIIEYEKDPKNRIKVPGKISEFHKVIQKEEYNRQRWDKKSLTGKQIRKYRILTTLLKALEDRGYNIFSLDNIYRIKVQNIMEHVEIGIYDYIKRYKRDLTSEELEKSSSKRTWAFVNEKTNKLVLHIYNNYGRSVRSIIETDDTKLEKLLNEAVIEITKEILNQRAYRTAREASEHRYFLEREKIRKEKEERENLIEEIKNKNTADSIRKYVEDCSAAYSAGNLQKENFAEWKQWALDFADELDPLLQSE